MRGTALKAWGEALVVYTQPRVLLVAALGFSSGLPLLLVLSTLSARLHEAEISLTMIGIFALVGQPYTFKFIWSPLIDKLPLPPFTSLLGRRRGWATACQLALMGALVALGASDPATDPWLTAVLALLVAFLSASQDIVLDAYRIEVLEERQYGAGAAMFVTGYRMGMLVAGAGALYLADLFNWTAAYGGMAVCMAVGLLAVLFGPNPDREAHYDPEPQAAASSSRGWRARIGPWMREAVLEPFRDFASRPHWIVILIFVVMYKFGDSLAGVLAVPFYLEMGFSKSEIAAVSKIFGLSMTLLGGVLGGLAVARYGLLRALMICGVLQMGSNLMFAVQAWVGYDLSFLTATIAIENISGGMGTAAFIAYLSSLCSLAHTATQYALLSSFMAFARTNLSASAGVMADELGWVVFFLATTLAALPGLVLLYWLMGKRADPSRETTTP